MIRLMLAVAFCSVLQLSVGCKHTGGECDCGPVPGDSVGVNSHIPNYGAAHSPAPAVATPNTLPNSSGFEPIAPPKTPMR